MRHAFMPPVVLALVASTFACGTSDAPETERVVVATDAGDGAGGSGGAGGTEAAGGRPPDALRPGPGRDARPLPADAGVPTGGAPVPDAARPPAPDMGAGGEPGPRPDAGPPPCETGTFDCPFRVEAFPFTVTRDTSTSPSDAADAYACRPETRETGPEHVYRVVVGDRGLLAARIAAPADGGPDVDLHLLDAPDPDACLARDNLAVARTVDAGVYYVVADTWADADGVEYPGEYTLTIEFTATGGDPCAVQDLDLEMVWGSCAPDIDCYEADGARFLRTPAVGPVVKEAHLVTVEDGFGEGWPSSFTDGIERHYALSEATSGYAMDRTEPWAPAGEGGSEYGQSAYGRPLPVLDEAWYVNMYWRRRPAPGTRVLVRDPESGRAVVAAGGYETGPGNPAHIGGVTEEIHDHLGTGHRSPLQLGFLVDQSLPLGPIDCGGR
ncbi:hypothetical protein L6V77_28145 [Myxococcota bacterium]|nr:hypothetical protein [Myxococcota bacterium]